MLPRLLIDLVNRTGRPHELQPTPTDVSVALRATAQIAEGPVWDARTGTMGDIDWNHPIGNLYRFGPDRT